MYKKFALMLFLATGALALQATAATASWASYGSTNPITSNSTSSWMCSSTASMTYYVIETQVCTVRSSGDVRGAIIVRNKGNFTYSASARMTVYYEFGGIRGNWSCPPSNVGPNSWSVCFGAPFAPASYKYYTEGYENNMYVGISGYN
jgi:hypothetical protein